MPEIKDLTPDEIVNDVKFATELLNDKTPSEEPTYKGKTNDYVARDVLKKYGLNDDDARKLSWASVKITDPEAPDVDIKTAVKIRNDAFNKIMGQGKVVKDYSPLIPKGEGSTKYERLISNFIPSEDVDRFLKAQGYDEITTDPVSKRKMVRRANEVRPSEFNPDRLDVMDFIQWSPDLAEGILTGVTVVNPVLGTALQATYGGGSEAARQYVSQKVGGRKEGDWDPLAIGGSAIASGLMGAAADTVGAIAKRAGPAVREIARTKGLVREEAPLLKAVADKLGITFTEEELARSPAKRKLFDAINRADESIIGYFTGEHAQRKMMTERIRKLDDVSGDILNEASLNSVGKSAEELKKMSIKDINFNMGDEVRKGVADSIKAKKEAADALYQKVNKVLGLKDFKADITLLNKESKSLMKKFEGNKEAISIIQGVVDNVKEGASLNAVNNIRSALLSKGRAAAKSGDAIQSKIYSDMAGALKNVEDDSYLKLIDKFSKGAETEFKKTAENAAKYANKDVSVLFPRNKNIKRIEQANQMKDDLLTARTLWRESNEEANKFLATTGKDVMADLGPKIKKIEGGRSEEMLQKMVPTNDLEKSKYLAEKYPALYDKALKATKAKDVQDIINKLGSTQTRSKADYAIIVEQMGKLGNDDLKILLGKDSTGKLEALQLVHKYAPELINASGTAINKNIIEGNILSDSSTAFKRWLLKKAYDVGNAEKLAKAFSMYTTPVKQTIKGAAQAAMSKEGAQ